MRRVEVPTFDSAEFDRFTERLLAFLASSDTFSSSMLVLVQGRR
jgi:hypothetical protein